MTHDTTADSEVITDLMLYAGLNALRALDLKNPVYSNRVYTVRAIYEDMRRLARSK